MKIKKTLTIIAALAISAGAAFAENYIVILRNFKETGQTLQLIELLAENNGGDKGKAVEILQDARDGKNPVAIPVIKKTKIRNQLGAQTRKLRTQCRSAKRRRNKNRNSKIKRQQKVNKGLFKPPFLF